MSKLWLIVEDYPVERTILERGPVGAGYRLMTAEPVRPGLVLLDVVMPHLNGHQTCRALKHTAGADRCPISC